MHLALCKTWGNLAPEGKQKGMSWDWAGKPRDGVPSQNIFWIPPTDHWRTKCPLWLGSHKRFGLRPSFPRDGLLSNSLIPAWALRASTTLNGFWLLGYTIGLIIMTLGQVFSHVETAPLTSNEENTKLFRTVWCEDLLGNCRERTFKTMTGQWQTK